MSKLAHSNEETMAIIEAQPVPDETPVPPFIAKEMAAKAAAPAPVAAKPKVKSKLGAIDPKAAEPSRPKITIFGKPGVGKTWGALDFPSVYYSNTHTKRL